VAGYGFACSPPYGLHLVRDTIDRFRTSPAPIRCSGAQVALVSPHVENFSLRHDLDQWPIAAPSLSIKVAIRTGGEA
jgi:hypothetical protein